MREQRTPSCLKQMNLLPSPISSSDSIVGLFLLRVEERPTFHPGGLSPPTINPHLFQGTSWLLQEVFVYCTLDPTLKATKSNCVSWMFCRDKQVRG